MIKYTESDRWSKIFVLDPALLERFVYETNIDIPSVFVSENSEIKLNSGNRLSIKPFDIKTIEEFEDLALNLIFKANEIAGKTFNNIQDAIYYLNNDIDCGHVNCVLMSKDDFNTCNIDNSIGNKIINDIKIYKIFENSNFKNFKNILSFPQIKSGELYLIPEPEFFGVVPISSVSGFEKYAIAIINSRATLKVII